MIVVGVVATAVIDLWALFVKHVLGLPATNWAFVGRWVAHLPGGRFVHRPISDSEPVANELAIGWLVHYLVGIAYSYLYLKALPLMGGEITFGSAVIFGLVTVIAAWFVLQPGLGLGVFARFAPVPFVIRALNLSVHFLFGCGLYLGWLLVG